MSTFSLLPLPTLSLSLTSSPSLSTSSSSSTSLTPTLTPTSSPSIPSTTSSPPPSSTPTSSTLPSSTQPTTSFTLSTSTNTSPSASSFPSTNLVASSTPLNGPSAVTVYTSATITSTPAAAPSSTSSSGFFSNTGAVAGTFTVVGLIGIAAVIAVALLVIRRRNSRSYDDDMEYLDRTPYPSSDPPMTQVTSPEEALTSDHGHYAAPPMPLASPLAAYYPDHAYALHPQAFSPATPAQHGYPSSYPVTYTHGYNPQHVYSPDDYDIAYPPSAPRTNLNMPNPHTFAGVEPDSAPVPSNQAVPPNVLRPSVNATQTAPKQWSNTRFSVDSFYTGIATDNQPGQAV